MDMDERRICEGIGAGLLPRRTRLRRGDPAVLAADSPGRYSVFTWQ